MNKWAIFTLFLVAISCSNSNKPGLKFSEKGREVPEFSADSAYHFVQQQVDFGPRVPNTQAHRKAQAFFEKKLRDYAGNNSVFTQTFTADGYDEKLELGNVIAAFNTTSPDRIMLSAHWDSRPRADQDSVRRDEPILGADDGGSGVAILLELARIFQKNPPPIGVDIVLFDGEDYGKSSDLAKYFIGSRYWAENPPVPGYKPRFGILLDMVGAKNAQFYKEQYSMVYAPNLVNEIWDIAQEMKHGNLFINQEGGAVSDDHVIINEKAHIPFIDIINHTRSARGGAEFAPHWHTHADRMNIISKNTLQAVGDVLAELIYNRL